MKMLMSKGYRAVTIGMMVSIGMIMGGLSGCVSTSPRSHSPDDLPGDSPGDLSGDSPDSGLEMPNVRFPRLSGRSVVAIDSLMADSADESVAIQGTVAQRVAILDGWLYQMQDDTGAMWVLADHAEPEVGQRATVEGTVRYEPIVVGEIDAGEVYLEAQSYRQESN